MKLNFFKRRKKKSNSASHSSEAQNFIVARIYLRNVRWSAVSVDIITKKNCNTKRMNNDSKWYKLYIRYQYQQILQLNVLYIKNSSTAVTISNKSNSKSRILFFGFLILTHLPTPIPFITHTPSTPSFYSFFFFWQQIKTSTI